jgi:hypothetical protein
MATTFVPNGLLSSNAKATANDTFKPTGLLSKSVASITSEINEEPEVEMSTFKPTGLLGMKTKDLVSQGACFSRLLVFGLT